MITAQVEQWSDCLNELQELFPTHWEELASNKDKVPLEPDYDAYDRCERADQLLLVTLRDGGSLVGYFVGIIAPGLHYLSCLTCSMDMFWTHPRIRNGTAELRLFRRVKKELEDRGVSRWLTNTKIHRDCGRLYAALGFEPLETIYHMWMGD